MNDGTHTYGYDFKDHLTASGTGGTQSASYAYDADGNRIQRVDGTGTTNKEVFRGNLSNGFYLCFLYT